MGEPLRVRLLGGFAAEGLDPAATGSRKARTLLKRLAVDAGSPVSVEALSSAVWPDGDEPANGLAVLVSRLRRAIGRERLTRSDAGYVLVVDWLDLHELRDRIAEAETRLAGSPASALAAARAALALARGPLLADEPEAPWAEAARAASLRLIARGRAAGARAALATGHPEQALELAAEALAEDPYDEAALRQLMRGHLESGSPARALAAYADAARLLADQLGVDPAPETREVHAEVLAATVAQPSAGRGSAAVRGKAPPGRRDVVEQLLERFRRSRSEAVVVAVEGEAGIGKSTVLRAVSARTRGEARVLQATADSTRALPLDALVRALGASLALLGPEEQQTLLEPDDALLGPLLLPERGGAGYRDVVAALDPSAAALPALQLALLGFAARLARQQPLVLVLDDAQLADGATLDWVSLAAGRGSALPLLVLLGMRSGEDAAPPAGVERLRLQPLDLAAVEEHLAQRGSAQRAVELLDRSGGNPLFLNELADAEPGALPASITESVAARADAAGVAGPTLRAAAVLGQEIDVDLLADVLDRPTVELLDHCEEGARRRLLSEAGSGYVFGHALVRDALAAAVPAARRVWLHRKAARVLSSRADADPLAVAAHARLAGDLPRAAEALRRAADVAGVRYAHVEALALAEESLELSPTWEGHLVRARALLMLQRPAEAQRAALLALESGGGAAAMEMSAHALYYRRDLDAAISQADRAAAATSDPDVRATCALLSARALHARGQLDDAQARLEPVVAGAVGPPAAQAYAAVWLGFLAGHRGDLARAEQLVGEDEVLELAARAPLPFADLYVLQCQVHHLAASGHPTRALALCERWQREVEERGVDRFVGRPLVYRGWALSLLAEPSAADVLQAAVEAAAGLGNREPLGQGQLDLAELALRRADTASAEALLAAVAPIGADLEVSNSWRIDLRRRYLVGRLLCDHGSPGEAAETAGELAARAAALGERKYGVLARLLAARAAARGGQRPPLEEVMADVRALDDVAPADAWRVTAELARDLGAPLLSAVAAERLTKLATASTGYEESLRAAGAAALP